MKELSLNILDVAENSVKAEAQNIDIFLEDKNGVLTIVIQDDGCGMKKEFLEQVTNPFTTTRTTRSVGLGIPFLKLAAEQTDGSFCIESVSREDNPEGHGTKTIAVFNKNHIDATPLGDIISTIVTLIQGNPQLRWNFKHEFENSEVSLDTEELKAVLGEVPLDTLEVLTWIREYLEEQYGAIL